MATLPENFSDDELCFMLGSDIDTLLERTPEEPVRSTWWNAFPLMCGVLIRMRSGLLRIYRRSECRFHRDVEGQPEQFFHLVRFVVHEKEKMVGWSKQDLWRIAEELTVKSLNLCLPLNRILIVHPLYPLHASGRMVFHKPFLQSIREYHDTIQRPEGTFEDALSPEVETLCKMERTVCPTCKGRRQLYCGPCGGLRLEATESLLPPRVMLPFDVRLLLHWNESLVKCTGIHTAVLGGVGMAHYQIWEKQDAQWAALVSSLDHTRDVLLFPYEDSTPAEVFPWHEGRWQLLVLEASWGYAKAMSQQIVIYRKKNNLPPLRSVSLSNVVGQYWRFQSEGHSAVSTIEAIAHTARVAGCTEQEEENLLTLFKVQKHRVMSNLKGGAKVPRAVEVTGVGMGSWREVEETEEV